MKTFATLGAKRIARTRTAMQGRVKCAKVLAFSNFFTA